MGDNYEGIKISYVQDERPLETRRRLLSVRGLIIKPFLFLAGDVLTAGDILEKIAVRFEEEQSKRDGKTMGVIGGASDHSPALTHAIISSHEGYLSVNLRFLQPPHGNKAT